MMSHRCAALVIGGFCLSVVACDGGARAPVAPRSISATGPSLHLQGAGPRRASGHADVQGTTFQNIADEEISFTAVSQGDGIAAHGEVEAHLLFFTGEQATVHAEVTCMTTSGAQAWIGTRVRRFVFDGVEVPSRVDAPMYFRVVDGGEGADAQDLSSLVFFPPAEDELTYCTTMPSRPILFPSVHGNVQVAQ
jgi:hypothetical protein